MSTYSILCCDLDGVDNSYVDKMRVGGGQKMSIFVKNWQTSVDVVVECFLIKVKKMKKRIMKYYPLCLIKHSAI